MQSLLHGVLPYLFGMKVCKQRHAVLEPEHLVLLLAKGGLVTETHRLSKLQQHLRIYRMRPRPAE